MRVLAKRLPCYLRSSNNGPQQVSLQLSTMHVKFVHTRGLNVRPGGVLMGVNAHGAVQSVVHRAAVQSIIRRAVQSMIHGAAVQSMIHRAVQLLIHTHQFTYQ